MGVETTVWTGRSSIMMYPTVVVWITVMSVTVVLIPIALILYLIKRAQARSFLYELTTQRLRLTTGIITKRTTEIELFRVKETVLEEPFLMRMRGMGNIVVRSSDQANPQITIAAISQAKDVREKLRTLELSFRMNNGAIREIEAN